MGAVSKRTVFVILFLIAIAAISGLYFVRGSSISRAPQLETEDCAALAGAQKYAIEGTHLHYKDNGPRIAVIYFTSNGPSCRYGSFASVFEKAGYSYIIPEYSINTSDIPFVQHLAMKDDAQHVIDFLGTRNHSDVTVVGVSIGSGAASFHTLRATTTKLLLISPILDIEKMRESKSESAAKGDFNNEKTLAGYHGSLLMIRGANDKFVSAEQGKQLFNSIPSSDKKLVVIDGADHTTVFQSKETFDAIAAFLKK